MIVLIKFQTDLKICMEITKRLMHVEHSNIFLNKLHVLHKTF